MVFVYEVLIKKGHVIYECDLIDKMICVVFDPNNVTWTLGIILNM